MGYMLEALTTMLKRDSSKVKMSKHMYESMITNQNLLLKKLRSSQDTERPIVSGVYSSSSSGVKVPIYPIALRRIEVMANDIDALRLMIEVIQSEMFKNGLEVVPDYKYLCKNEKCGKKYMTKPIDTELLSSIMKGNVDEDEKLKCDVCGKTDFEQPTPQDRKKLQDLIEHEQNDNGQKIEQVARMFERDLDIFDNAYLVLIYDYEKNTKNKIESQTLHEMVVVSPVNTALIGNMAGQLGIDDLGTAYYVCPFHRSMTVARKKGEDVPRCKICDCETKVAILQIDNGGGFDGGKGQMYYAIDEVIFKAGKYKPGLMYGYTPIFSIWSKADALKHMDEYIRKYFDKQRPPRSMMFIGTKNIQTTNKAWDQMTEKAKQDPYELNPVLVETEQSGRNMVQMVDLTGSLQELQFIDVRSEFKRAIGAMYGVLPLFSGDLPNGWSQDGLAMAVSNRKMAWGQKVLADSFFDPLTQLLGVKGWKIRLKSGEMTDELRVEQIQAQKINNATAMRNMGFEVMVNAEGEFVFSSKPTQPTMIGGQGGLGGSKDNTQSGFKTEEMTQNEGEPSSPRQSDAGGTSQGSPASGDKTSRSQK